MWPTRPIRGCWPRRYGGSPRPGVASRPRAGATTRTRVRDRSRSAGARAREIGAKLRLRAAQGRDEAQAVVRRVTRELAGLAERAAADAEKLLANARRALRRAHRAAAKRTAAGTPDPVAGRRRGWGAPAPAATSRVPSGWTGRPHDLPHSPRDEVQAG